VELEQQENTELPQLRIMVSDDGCGLSEGNLMKGVGLSMIDDLASSWSLKTVEGHGLFEAKLALH
jgi:glucose-6-phosphate-specific signal transduction histidine kinase